MQSLLRPSLERFQHTDSITCTAALRSTVRIFTFLSRPALSLTISLALPVSCAHLCMLAVSLASVHQKTTHITLLLLVSVRSPMPYSRSNVHAPAIAHWSSLLRPFPNGLYLTHVHAPTHTRSTAAPHVRMLDCISPTCTHPHTLHCCTT
jgi:hypothetical protein